MSKNLFDEFPKVSTKEWKQKINLDLKGKDYNETLIWNSADGIDVKPFYDEQDLETSLPSTSVYPSTWKITQSIFVNDSGKSNHIAKQYLENGAESLCFVVGEKDFEIESLLKDIDLEKHTVIFKVAASNDSDKIINKILDFFQRRDLSIPLIELDVISNFAETGNWQHSKEQDWEVENNYFQKNATISVDLSLYQNAGANMVQQLAYTLSHLNEYLFSFKNEGHLNNSKELKVFIRASVGSNYFFEIAKLKALRVLIQSLSDFYNIPLQPVIYSSPTKRNKTIYDYNSNMIRTTMECMAAILGGSDYVENLAYDALYHKKNEFGERIARNQLLILKLESHFEDISNATEGTYYIESLTQQLATKALELFKNLEKGGGFLELLHNGKIQTKIEDSEAKEQQEFNTNQIGLVGANFHPNLQDKMKDELELYPFVKYKKRKTLIKPIIRRRLAEKLEHERLEKEK